MANIKSAQKRIKVSEKKSMQNQMLVSKLKTGIKKYNAAIALGNIALAESLLPVTVGMIDSYVVKGIIPRNTADRKKAALSKKLSDLKSGKIQAEAVPGKKSAPKAVKAEAPKADAPAAVKEDKKTEKKAAPKAEKPAKAEKAEKAVKAEKPAKAEKAEKADVAEKPAKKSAKKAE